MANYIHFSPDLEKKNTNFTELRIIDKSLDKRNKIYYAINQMKEKSHREKRLI